MANRSSKRRVTEAERKARAEGWADGVDERTDEVVVVRRRPVWRRLALVLLVLIVGVLLALWLLRKQIAADYIDRELARRGVQATYRVKRLGFGTQQIEGLVLGDPRNPDLTA